MRAPRWLGRPSRLALRIYAIGLVQFIVVAGAMEIDHRMRRPEPPPPRHSPTEVAPMPPPPGGRRPPPGPHGPPWLGWPIVLVLGVVGVASWLTARSITRPLSRLTSATRAFGAGELDARARMDRADEIGEVSRAFDDMADRIKKLLLAERELLANVSHELRTPLARIRVALDLAAEDPEGTAALLGEIAQDLAELERLVDDVLASARLALDSDAKGEKSKLPLRAERIDTRDLLERSAAKFRAAHPERVLDVTVADDLAPVLADAVLLRRVVDNLLDNAHKYSDDGGAPIVLDARNEADRVVIEVRDRGIGIAPDDMRRLFEPFFRADRSRTRATGGLGLGLALARRVVEAHEGTIAFESEPGKGTTARVLLPRVT